MMLDKPIKVAVVCLLLCAVTPLYADIDRIYYNNQYLFLNGANLAWRSFADDIGPNPSTPDIAHFTSVFSQFEEKGGNVMRLWLHTNGAKTPQWSGFTVTGPGTDTIDDLQAILDLAWEHKVSVMCCLWSFDMLRESYGTTVTDRSYAILTDPTYRQTYIDNSLIPMVTALAGHPAIVAWEIFNEPEGMSDEFGWSGIRHVPMARIQEFVNLCAGAIHRTDPTVMVTNGCWDMQAGTDVDGHTNYYTDARLIAAGGDADGTLDFYCIHYYDWAGTEHSPFLHQASYWGLDKPLVIAEFYPDCDSQYCTSTPYESLYQNGYAGALGWSWTDVNPSLLLEQMDAIWAAHPEDVEILIDPYPPAAPNGLSATAGEAMVSLDWNDNSEDDLDGYNIYRSTITGGPYDQLNDSLLSSSDYTDNMVGNGVTYYYAVTAVDEASNESDDSNQVSATPTNTIPPAAPTALVATDNSDGTISLDWNDNSEADMDGYNVHRSTITGGPYDQLNGPLLSSSDYIDDSVTIGETYYYVVTAVDYASNESGNSNQDSATATDTTPPAAPTGLTATAGNRTVSLDWDDNGESDLDGYNIYRSSPGEPYDQLNDTLLSTSDYVDNSVTNGTTYYYIVTAVDMLSNESDDSSEVVATPKLPGSDVEILGDWASGTSHDKETGSNRALIVVAHAEHQDVDVVLNDVTYGGQSMTKVIDRLVTSSNGTRAYVAAYILDEAGVAASTNNTFVPDWSVTPDCTAYASILLSNVNQTVLVGANDSNETDSSTPNPITTTALSTSDGDMVIDGATCGNSGLYMVNKDFTEGIDQQFNSTATGVTGHKLATGVAETPSVTHSSPNRQVITGFVVQAAGPDYQNCLDVQDAGLRLLSDLDGNCYVDYQDLEIMTDYWLNTDCDELDNCEDADFEPTDGAVDLFDYSDFAAYWMQCNNPGDSNCTPNWP